jgi:MerR family transcriptional regulator/heat shock protein HspR
MAETDERHDANDPVISIGVLADRVGLSVSAVRKYENEGLVIAHRTPAGHRLFSHEDIDRVRTIHHTIQDLGLNIEAIRRMQALLPCWDLLPCSEDMRQGCPAYQARTRPCWTIKGLSCAPQGNECRQCAVYRYGSMCTENIKALLHDQNGMENAGAALAELMQLKKHSKGTED